MNRRDEMEQERRIAERDLEPQWSERQAHLVSEMCRFVRPCDSEPIGADEMNARWTAIVDAREERTVLALRILRLACTYPVRHGCESCDQLDETPGFCDICGWKYLIDLAMQELKIAIHPIGFEQRHDLSFLWGFPERDPVEAARLARSNELKLGGAK